MFKRKILFLIESLGGGGAEKVLSILVRHIDKKRFDVTVCSISDAGVYREEIEKNVRYCSILGNVQKKSMVGRLIYKIKYKAIYDILPMWLVYSLFVPKRYDVEVAFVEGYTTKLLSASTNKKSFKIAWVHIDLLKNPWTQNIKVYGSVSEERHCYARFDKIVCVSDTVRENFIKRFDLRNVIRIYNPIDKNEILEKASVPCEYPQQTKDLKLITIGRLVPQKGYDRLLRVIKKIKGDKLKCKLLILGDGEMKAQLSDYIRENDFAEDVMLYGFERNPYKYLKNADCFVCSSRSEGFSLVIAEAMVLGIPIVSTYCSGPNELLEEGKYGMLVNNTEEDLYVELKNVVQRPNILLEYQRKSLIKAEDFDIESSIKEIESLLCGEKELL